MKTLFVKIVLILLLIAMIYNLFKALKVMNKTPSNQADTNTDINADSENAKPEDSMSKYIGRRVMLSVCIIIFLLISVATGLIELNPSPYLQ